MTGIIGMRSNFLAFMSLEAGPARGTQLAERRPE
jgi:hypothetical protein